MRRITYLLRQLLPLTYRSHYHTQSGQAQFEVWKMWFGRVFAHECVTVAEESS